ncbi:MAG: NUDIX hydrolase [Cytophaga sp.]|uniref:NUDIX hydrolase n=1 Tax=Cytophaga sp. TaxID=29535 RepID=UPI003F8169F1
MKRKAKVLFVHKVSESVYRLLLGRRVSSNESFWWIPGGSVEAGETDFEAGLRELGEELFLTKDFTDVLHAYKRDNKIPVSVEYTSSQAVNIIFLVSMQYTGNIPLPSIKDEFEEVAWFDLNNMPQNMSREFSYIEKELQQAVRKL